MPGEHPSAAERLLSASTSIQLLEATEPPAAEMRWISVRILVAMHCASSAERERSSIISCAMASAVSSCMSKANSIFFVAVSEGMCIVWDEL